MGVASHIECIKYFVSALNSGTAAVFLGAGFSRASGFVDWKELMRGTAEDLGLDVDQETDLIAIAQYHINERLGNRSIINQILIDQFVKEAKCTPNHKILANLPIYTFWTTNYDDLIERSLMDAGKIPDTKRNSENICITIPKRDAVVYKMHGDISIPNDAILTKEDYETYETNRAAYSLVLQADLLSKTFIFIGFSFEDPNLLYLLNRIKSALGTKSVRNHYCIFKKEYNISNTGISRKQELRLRDLNRYGITAILIDDYKEINVILSQISYQYKRSNIFISGAAEDFDEFGSEEVSLKFVHDLTKAILTNSKKIISGFGYNIGGAVLNGTLEYVYSTKYKRLDEYINLMPFPQKPTEDLAGLTEDEVKVEKKKKNMSYRKLMISKAGIAIFLFGNKIKNASGTKTTILSNGMEEEFNIAIEMGLVPIPVGATGYMSKVLWDKVMVDFEKYVGSDSELKELFMTIGSKGHSEKEIINATLQIINKLNRI